MQEEKQHYLYVLVPENGDTFKIGHFMSVHWHGLKG
ncbi:hypothetical protein ECO9570_27891, partial [Escherichia coli O111:H8 str. CVM9570]